MQPNNIILKLKKYICLTLLIIPSLFLTACSNQNNITEDNTKDSMEVVIEKETNTTPQGLFDDLDITSFQVSSEDLQNGVWDTIITNTENGSNVSPQLTWDAIPDAACYVIYMTDITAYNWIHWKSNNITDTTLPQGWAPRLDYIGPYPPGGTHTYEIYVIALKEPVERVQGAHNSDNPRFKECVLALDEAADGRNGNILAYGYISGTYTKGE